MNTRFEFAGIIPSVNETKFDDPFVENETFGITQDIEEWRDMHNENYTKSNYEFNMTPQLFDIRGVSNIKRKMDIAGFMMEPAALVDGVSITAKTRRLDIANGLNDFVNEHKDSGKKIFIFSLVFVPNMPCYISMDLNTFEPIIHDTPFMSNDKGYWIIRFAEL